MTRKRMSLVAVTCMGLSASGAWASVLLPDTSQYANQPSVAGTPKYIQGLPAYFSPANQVAQLVAPHAVSPFLNLLGVTTSTVYKNPSTNLLTFDYVVSAALTNTSPIVRTSFEGPWSEVGILNVGADGSGTSGSESGSDWFNGDPLFIERDPVAHTPAVQWRTGGGADDIIGTSLNPGETSSHFWFETDARDFTVNHTIFADHGAIGYAEILVPTPTIPEPVTCMLLGSGILGLASRRRRIAN